MTFFLDNRIVIFEPLGMRYFCYLEQVDVSSRLFRQHHRAHHAFLAQRDRIDVHRHVADILERGSDQPHLVAGHFEDHDIESLFGFRRFGGNSVIQ